MSFSDWLDPGWSPTETTWTEGGVDPQMLSEEGGNRQRMGRQATNTHYNVLSIQGRQGSKYQPHFATKETEAEKGN